MGNRSRFVFGAAAATGASAGVRAMRSARRRARLRAVADGIRGSILPTHVPPSTEEEPTVDAAHAPGHQHLNPPAETVPEAAAERPLRRPWTKRHHALRHPGRG